MYSSIVDLRTYLKITSTGDDVLLSKLLDSATTAIETYCRRVFIAASATHYYDETCVDGDILWLDGELYSASKVLNGDAGATEITSSYYWLLPRNAPPYYQIKLKSSQSWDFTIDGEIAVTGMWGYSVDPPADIEQACLRLAAYYYKQRDAQVFDVTAQPDQGQLIIPKGIPADVKQTLDRYVRHTL
jgi:uncharacterized phiE125 gp8 family phage protein